mgnify:CR=1 FL=1
MWSLHCCVRVCTLSTPVFSRVMSQIQCKWLYCKYGKLHIYHKNGTLWKTGVEKYSKFDFIHSSAKFSVCSQAKVECFSSLKPIAKLPTYLPKLYEPWKIRQSCSGNIIPSLLWVAHQGLHLLISPFYFHGFYESSSHWLFRSPAELLWSLTDFEELCLVLSSTNWSGQDHCDWSFQSVIGLWPTIPRNRNLCMEKTTPLHIL